MSRRIHSLPFEYGDSDHYSRKDWQSVEGEGGRLLTSGSLRDMENEAQNMRFFTKIFTITQIVGILTIVLTLVWLNVYRGGFAWQSNPKLEFNWHPLFMILGLVFLYANGALVYRAFRNEAKRKLKVMHAVFLFSALIFSVIGLQAVFDSHNLNKDALGNDNPIPNLYSLHSWIGLGTVLLFACQWTVGLLTFLFPGLRPSLRNAYMPVHQYFGVAIFIGAIASCLLGLTEKAFFVLSSKYPQKGPESILVNMIGLLLVVFGGLVMYMVGNSQFRRRATEDEILLTDGGIE